MPLILTIGPPGCGKTSWANETFGPNWLKLERDALRRALFGGKKSYFNSPFSPKERSKVITLVGRQSIRAWPNDKVVCFDTNLFWFTTQHFIREFQTKDVKLVLMKMDWETCLERNNARPTDDIVPESELREYWREFVSKDAWWLEPQWKNQLFTPDTLEL